MLDIEFIRDNAQIVKTAAEQKGMSVDIDRLLQLDQERRTLIHSIEQFRSQKNSASKEIIHNFGDAREQKIAAMKEVDKELTSLEKQLKKIEKWYQEIMYQVPNIPTSETPIGLSSDDNVLVRKHGEPTQFSFEPKSHIEIGTSLGIIDIKRGVKLMGNRGYILKNDGAYLEMALMNYALDFLRKRNFTVMMPPLMAYDEFFYGTGYFPWAQKETFKATDGAKTYNLIGSAEVPLTAYHSDETLDEDDLPKQYTAFTPCFRTEVGSYGRDTKGLYRIRQFNKVEQVILCKNSKEESKKMFQTILKNAEDFLQSLELPYRVMRLCTGDMGAGQVEKFDIETWMPSRKSYGETHSCSRFHEYQARRLNIRYKAKDGSIKFVHTLNNTLIASPRILIPLLEIHQQASGTIMVPKVLQKYMNGQQKIG